MQHLHQYPSIESYRALFQQVKASLPGTDRAWLEQLRHKGLQCFTDLGGFPAPRVEEWKYTNLRELEKITFSLPDRHQKIKRHDLDSIPTIVSDSCLPHVIRVVDGLVHPDLSCMPTRSEEVMITSLHAALKSDDHWLQEHLGRIGRMTHHPFMALNTAFMEDGVVIRIPRGVEIDAPIMVILTTSEPGHSHPRLWHPRLLIVAEAGSRATVVEHHIGLTSSPYFTNGTVEITLDPQAHLRHYKLQQEATTAYHLATTTIHLAQESQYRGFTLTVGGCLARNEVHVTLGGRDGHCHVNGAYLLQKQQHCDATSVITHASPHCTSRQVYKGVVDDHACAVFQGKIEVQPHAQKTDGYQLNQALLLSDDAKINSKPELEIFADDVKCSHGATAGALNDEALFYLKTRGIDPDTARGLLITAFIQEVIDEIDQQEIRKGFGTIVHQWLEERCKN